MDMRQIRQFIAVVEHGNMVHAADAIHLSQPALTKSIKNLEGELGVQLLTRGPRGVKPTIYGDVLLQHARLLHNQGERAIEEIRALRAGHVGRLRLGVANLSISCLPRVVARLLTTMPGLSLEVVDGTYEALTALVREGALDAVASGFPTVHRAEDLVHEELVSETFLLVCRAGHPLVTQEDKSAKTIAEQRWIVANRPRQIVEMLEFTFRSAGVSPPTLHMESASMSFLKAVLLEGDFVTVLPRGVVARELDTGTLVAVAPDVLLVPTVEGVIFRAEAVHPPALSCLIQAIKAERAAAPDGTPVQTTLPERRNASPRRTAAARPVSRRRGRRSTHRR